LDAELSEAMKEYLASQGIQELYPPQKSAVPHLLAGKNLLMAVPTASGKSLVAYLAIIDHLSKGGKAIYLCPLKALAAEKYEDLLPLEKNGHRIAMAVGDYDRLPQLEDLDVLVATSEKADSILRLRPEWVQQLTLVVVDECHLLTDPHRGPTLEVLLTRMLHLNPDLHLIGLSATVGNPRDLALWLNAELVESDWRPVELKPGVYSDGVIHWPETNSRTELSGDGKPVWRLIDDVVKRGHQALVFVNSRKNAESLARELSARLSPGRERKQLVELAKLVQGEDKSVVGGLLAKLIAGGAAFHHAGLDAAQRKLVENGFRDRLLKVIVATPTLAAGVNLPARLVIIRDTFRWGDHGREPLSRMEVQQMMGRAGRPRFDDEGEAVIIAAKDYMRNRLMDEYIFAPPEEVVSKLSRAGVLRTHVLASFAAGLVSSEKELRQFFALTLFAFQHDLYVLDEVLDQALLDLMEWEFLETSSEDEGQKSETEDEMIRPTRLGRKVSQLYVDPASAAIIVDCLRRLEDWADEGNPILPFDILLTICGCPDMLTFSVSGKKDDFFDRIASAAWWPGVEHREPNAVAKTAAVLEAWTNEFTMPEIEQEFRIGPGDLWARQDTANWLIHATQQLGMVIQIRRQEVEEIALRLKYGARQELMPLLRLPQIGRVRARNLYDSGFTGIVEIAAAKEAEIARVPGLGPQLAKNVLQAAAAQVQQGGPTQVTAQGPTQVANAPGVHLNIKSKRGAGKAGKGGKGKGGLGSARSGATGKQVAKAEGTEPGKKQTLLFDF